MKTKKMNNIAIQVLPILALPVPLLPHRETLGAVVLDRVKIETTVWLGWIQASFIVTKGAYFSMMCLSILQTQVVFYYNTVSMVRKTP